MTSASVRLRILKNYHNPRVLLFPDRLSIGLSVFWSFHWWIIFISLEIFALLNTLLFLLSVCVCVLIWWMNLLLLWRMCSKKYPAVLFFHHEGQNTGTIMELCSTDAVTHCLQPQYTVCSVNLYEFPTLSHELLIGPQLKIILIID